MAGFGQRYDITETLEIFSWRERIVAGATAEAEAMSKHAHDAGFPDPGHDHETCLARAVSRAEAAFEQRGMRMTDLRRKVLKEIASSHCAIGAYDILDRLARRSDKRLAPISVYRALDSLVEAGVVHRLESRNAFFACHGRHARDRRQIVLACEGCGAVAEVGDDVAFERIGDAARKNGFEPSRMLVEVIGTCAPCAAANHDQG